MHVSVVWCDWRQPLNSPGRLGACSRHGRGRQQQQQQQQQRLGDGESTCAHLVDDSVGQWLANGPAVQGGAGRCVNEIARSAFTRAIGLSSRLSAKRPSARRKRRRSPWASSPVPEHHRADNAVDNAVDLPQPSRALQRRLPREREPREHVRLSGTAGQKGAVGGGRSHTAVWRILHLCICAGRAWLACR